MRAPSVFRALSTPAPTNYRQRILTRLTEWIHAGVDVVLIHAVEAAHVLLTPEVLLLLARGSDV